MHFLEIWEFSGNITLWRGCQDFHAYLGEGSGDGAEEEHGEGHDGGHRGNQGGRQVVSLGGLEWAIFLFLDALASLLDFKLSVSN